MDHAVQNTSNYIGRHPDFPDIPIGRATVQAYDKAKAYAPDADEAKMIEIVSRSRVRPNKA